MNIEDFFIKEYTDLKEENQRLKDELASKQPAGSMYGVTDLGQGIEMVMVKVEGSYTFTSGNYDIVKMGSEKLREIEGYSDDKLIQWAEGFKYGSYYGNVLEIEKKKYRYTVEITDMDGTELYALDPRHGRPIVELGGDDALNEWVESSHLEELLAMAADIIRERIEMAIAKAAENEQKAAQEVSEG